MLTAKNDRLSIAGLDIALQRIGLSHWSRKQSCAVGRSRQSWLLAIVWLHPVYRTRQSGSVLA